MCWYTASAALTWFQTAAGNMLPGCTGDWCYNAGTVHARQLHTGCKHSVTGASNSHITPHACTCRPHLIIARVTRSALRMCAPGAQVGHIVASRVSP
jgi:hypothetical protein